MFILENKNMDEQQSQERDKVVVEKYNSVQDTDKVECV